MNNRKQQINSFLNSLTSTELNTYLKENKINRDAIRGLELLQKHKENKKEDSHLQKLINKNCDISSIYENMFRIGQSQIIAYILYYGLQKDFKIEDFVEFFKNIMDKEMVYEIMKDL